MLAIANLSYRYGATLVLRAIDLALAAGTIVGLVGPNGAGKSTLLKCAAGLLKGSGGSVMIAGRRIEDYGRRDLARAVAYVPQQAGAGLALQSSALQVVEVVAIGRAVHRGHSSDTDDRAIIWDALAALDLAPLAFQPFGALSGGQRQRVLIARALAQQAPLLILDEPTSALDPYYQLETMHVLHAIATTRRTATLVALHDLSLAARLSDTVVLLHRGGVHACGPWQAVLTPDTLAETYGIAARIGLDGGIPYIVPLPLK